MLRRRASEAAGEAGLRQRLAAGLGKPGQLRRSLLTAAVTRLYIFVVGLAATYVIGVQSTPWAWRYPRYAEAFHGFLGHLLNSWATWDGVWYIKIAQGGYADADVSTAFFPLYPLLLRYTGLVFHNNLVITGIVLSLLFYFLAMIVLHKLIALDFGARIAGRTVLFVSIFPVAFFLQAVYTESLFLLLSLACFYWSRLGRWRLAGLAGLLATLSRSAGVLLLVPMAMMYLEQRDWDWRRTDRHVVNLLMIPEGLLIWMAYLSLSFHKPFLFAAVQDQWRRSFHLPHYAVWRGLLAAGGGALQLLSRQTANLYWPTPSGGGVNALAIANIVNLIALVIAIVFIVYGLRRIPRAYSAYVALAVVFPLLWPSKYMPLLSLPRFLLAGFPLFLSMALYADGHRRRFWTLAVLYVLALTVLAAKHAVFSWVA